MGSESYGSTHEQRQAELTERQAQLTKAEEIMKERGEDITSARQQREGAVQELITEARWPTPDQSVVETRILREFERAHVTQEQFNQAMAYLRVADSMRAHDLEEKVRTVRACAEEAERFKDPSYQETLELAVNDFAMKVYKARKEGGLLTEEELEKARRAQEIEDSMFNAGLE